MVEGSNGLKRFNDTIKDDFGREGQYFGWEKRRDGPIVLYIHPRVEEKMRFLSSQRVCRAGNTALGDLLAIVQTRLLVVDLASSNPRSPIRADSVSLKGEIDKIVERGSRYPNYWLQGSGRWDVPNLHPTTASTPAASERHLENAKGKLTVERSSPISPLPAHRIPRNVVSLVHVNSSHT